MSRLSIRTKSQAEAVVEDLYHSAERRIASSPPGLCPVDMTLTFLNLCHAQSCGKCVPCRVGLGQLSTLLRQVLDGEATLETIDTIEATARVIHDTADCAIGIDAALQVLLGVRGLPGRLRLSYHRGPLAWADWRILCPAWPCVPPVWIFPAMWRWSPKAGTPTRLKLIRKEHAI